MKIALIQIGRTHAPYLQAGFDEYFGRLRRYIQFESIVLPDIRTTKRLSETQQKEQEGILILGALNPSDRVVLLDEHGKEFTSREFATTLEREMASGVKRLVYVIGGPYGFSEAIYSRADAKVSFSRMTFSHEMIRLFFIEQIYRAMTILRNEPYHHD